MTKFLMILRYIILIIFCISALIPFYWMITTAFNQHIWIDSPGLFPIPPYLEAMKDVLIHHPFSRWIINSTIIAVGGSFGAVFFAVLAAFAFACLSFKGRDLIFYILLSTMILPAFLTMIPRFFLIAQIGWINTYWAVFVPAWFSIGYVFLLKQFFLSIPYDTLDSARIDGASLWQVLFRIVLPQAKSLLAAIFIINFLGSWNSLLWPAIIIRSRDMQTVTLGISGFYTLYQAQYNKIMSASIIGLIPVLIMFAIFSRNIEKGLKMQLKF